MEHLKEKISVWLSGAAGGFTTMNFLHGFVIMDFYLWIAKFVLSCLSAIIFAIAAEFGKTMYRKYFQK
jgi:hypothetical protein